VRKENQVNVDRSEDPPHKLLKVNGPCVLCSAQSLGSSDIACGESLDSCFPAVIPLWAVHLALKISTSQRSAAYGGFHRYPEQSRKSFL
jgi:hypothetical protein